MWKILRLLNIIPRIAKGAEFPSEIDVLWLHADKLAAGIELGSNVLNRDLIDISKPHVDATAAQILGYSIVIDPQKHDGKAVRKSEANAAHDGAIIECPCPRERGYVYQRLVDAVNGEFAVEYRLIVCGALMPLALLKKRPPQDRFRNVNTEVTLVPIESILTPEEIALITLFTVKIGMAYGELDVLRDVGSQQIYVIDANRTPSGPSRPLPLDQMADILIVMASGVESLLSGSGNHYMRAAEVTTQLYRKESRKK